MKTKLQQHAQVMLSNLNTKHTNGQHPELSGAVPHPSTECRWVKIVPGGVKYFIRQFSATPVLNATQLRAGLDYKGPGIWEPENRIQQMIHMYTKSILILNTTIQFKKHMWFLLVYGAFFKHVFSPEG